MSYLGEEIEILEGGAPIEPKLDFWQFIGKSLAVLWKDWPMVDMKVVGFVGADYKALFVLDGTCPHHGAHVTFNRVGEIHIDQYDFQGHPPIPSRCVGIMRCPGCFGYVLGIARKKPGSIELEYEAHYPIGSAIQWENPDPEKPDIPEHILSDFNEALRCYSVDAFNAAAEMCGRTLEAICLERGADPRAKLREKIESLALAPFLCKRAHTIRLGRDRAAHPPDEPLGETAIAKEEADDLLSFTHEVLEGIYVSEARLERRDFSKFARKQRP